MFVRVLYLYESGDRVGAVGVLESYSTRYLREHYCQYVCFLRFATLFNSELRLVSYATELY